MAKRRKKRRGREVYERWLAVRAREGLTWPELSRRSGIPATTLQEWGRRLAGTRRGAASGAAFVELAARAPASQGLEVVLRSGRRLVLASAQPPEGLAELVAVLESC